MHSVFRAVVTTVVPEAVWLDAVAWAELDGIVERALADRAASLRYALAFFLTLIEWLAVARHGRRFTALDAARRTRFLSSLGHAPLPLVRRGFWGLRTLAFLGYYGRAAAAEAIGYRADPRGWEARL